MIGDMGCGEFCSGFHPSQHLLFFTFRTCKRALFKYIVATFCGLKTDIVKTKSPNSLNDLQKQHSGELDMILCGVRVLSRCFRDVSAANGSNKIDVPSRIFYHVSTGIALHCAMLRSQLPAQFLVQSTYVYGHFKACKVQRILEFAS